MYASPNPKRSPNWTRAVASTLVFALLLAWGAPGVSQAADGPDPVDPSGAWDDLNELTSYLKRAKDRTNQEIVQYLKAVAEAYGNFAMPEAPPADADAAALKEHAKLVTKLQKDQEKFNKSAEKQIFKALTLDQIENGTNTRDDVNAAAAGFIGGLRPYTNDKQRSKLSGRVAKAIEGLDKADWAASFVLDAMFLAIAQLNHTDGLEWMLDNYVHNNSREEDVVRLIGAHKAMVKFTDVPGKLRYAVVEKFIKVYAGTESQAEQNSTDPAVRAKREFWDRLKVDAVAVLQHYAGNPENENNQVYNKVNDFQDWFRDHKNPRKAPWIDVAPPAPSGR